MCGSWRVGGTSLLSTHQREPTVSLREGEEGHSTFVCITYLKSICSLRDGGICWESLGRGSSQPGDMGEEPLQACCGGKDTTTVQMVCLELFSF